MFIISNKMIHVVYIWICSSTCGRIDLYFYIVCARFDLFLSSGVLGTFLSCFSYALLNVLLKMMVMMMFLSCVGDLLVMRW